MPNCEDARADALTEAVLRCGEAWARGDAPTLDALLSPAYTHGDIYGGFQGRATWLDYAGGRAGRPTRIGFRELAIRMFGDTAVVTGINDIQSMSVEGDALTLRFTQVWLWRDGHWLREAFQATVSDRA